MGYLDSYPSGMRGENDRNHMGYLDSYPSGMRTGMTGTTWVTYIAILVV